MTSQAASTLEATARAFYERLDANDPRTFTEDLTSGAVFAFNDAEPVIGAEAISDFVGAWKNNFKSVTHDITAITADEANGRAGVEVLVTYAFPDGNVVEIKGASFLDVTAAGISGWRVYVDTTRLS